MENGKGYVLNGGAYSSEYDNSSEIFDQSFDSFRIITPSSGNNGTDLTGVIVAVIAVVIIGAVAVIFLLRKNKR